MGRRGGSPGGCREQSSRCLRPARGATCPRVIACGSGTGDAGQGLSQPHVVCGRALRPYYEAVLPAACHRESQAGTRAGEHIGVFPLEHPVRRHLRDHHQINPRLSLRRPALIPALQRDGTEVSPACSGKPLPGHRDGLEMGLTGRCSRSRGVDLPGGLPGMFVEPFLPVL